MRNRVMRNSAWLLALVVMALAGEAGLGDTFLNGLAGPSGLANEGNQGSSPANDRFLNSPSFIGAPYNWSGVGLSNGGSWATMISPTYFVSPTTIIPPPARRSPSTWTTTPTAPPKPTPCPARTTRPNTTARAPTCTWASSPAR